MVMNPSTRPVFSPIAGNLFLDDVLIILQYFSLSIIALFPAGVKVFVQFYICSPV